MHLLIPTKVSKYDINIFNSKVLKNSVDIKGIRFINNAEKNQNQLITRILFKKIEDWEIFNILNVDAKIFLEINSELFSINEFWRNKEIIKPKIEKAKSNFIKYSLFVKSVPRIIPEIIPRNVNISKYEFALINFDPIVISLT